MVLAECLRKKDTPGRLYKSTTEKKSFVNREWTLIISERSKLNNNTYLYWLKENGPKKKKKKKVFEGKNYLRWKIRLLNNGTNLLLF